jgi:hypothetical protein
MKFTSLTAISALLVSTASAGSFFQQGAGFRELIGPATGGQKVPGENPLSFCGDTSHDLATIESVNLIPNPPTP